MPEVVNTSVLSVGDHAAEVEDDRPVMIDVDHVSMSFNMASEQLNNLKEYAIAIARGKLFFEEFKALDDVSFKVRKGDVFGIMGTNGSGKSTILKIIAGVLEPSKGTCTVNGNIAPLIELGAGFDMDLSARENIYLNGALLGYQKAFIDEHFDEIVEFAEVEKFLDMPLKNYSSGMVARIAFAIATVIVPEILVVDEVLSVGDFMFQKKCEDRITQLIEEYGVTVLIVSHSNAQIARLCNKAVWIEKGHVRIAGEAKGIARIYSGLAGRTGSSESESEVFEELKTGLGKVWPGGVAPMITGDTAVAVNANMVLRAFEGRPSGTDALVVAVDGSHGNGVVANALAASLNAPVASMGTDGLSESAERVFYALRPRKVFIVGAVDRTRSAIKAIRDFSWLPEVHVFDEALCPFDSAVAIYKYGVEHSLWGESVALAGFDDNAESLCAAPFLYAKKMPCFVFNDENQLDDDFVSMLQAGGINQIYLFGKQAVNTFSANLHAGEFETHRIFGDSCDESCAAIARFVDEQLGCKQDNIVIASASISQWPELLSCGCYVAKKGSSLLLMHSESLDSCAFCLRYVRDRLSRGVQVEFISGRSGPTEGDKDLFLGMFGKCIQDQSR